MISPLTLTLPPPTVFAPRPYLERRARFAAGVSPDAVYAVLAATRGGSTLPGLRPLWSLRGRLAGSSGPVWELFHVAAPERIVFIAELPRLGRAWLSYELTREASGTRVSQVCTFLPAGRRGRLYWHAVRPAHALVFRAMLRGVVQRVSREVA